jgi:hypothetical protein
MHPRRYWLDYDPVALAVLVIGICHALIFTKQSCPSRHRLELWYTHIVPCERIPQKFTLSFHGHSLSDSLGNHANR